MFDARKTLHIGRENIKDRFVASGDLKIPFEIVRLFTG